MSWPYHAGMDESVEIQRLSEGEKECLRRFARQQTAKEMALDLGITHHAVEKRLKHARTKLGVHTSREAARILAMAEGYDQAVSGPPDLASHLVAKQGRHSHAKTYGVVTMSILAAATLAFALQASGAEGSYGALPGSGAGPETGYRGVSPEDMIRPSEAEIAVITQATFDYLDEDKSGFLEGRESPVSPPANPQPVQASEGEEIRPMTPKQATEGFYAQADSNGDGRVSYPEYHEWARVPLERFGIPGEWQENLQPTPNS